MTISTFLLLLVDFSLIFGNVSNIVAKYRSNKVNHNLLKQLSNFFSSQSFLFLYFAADRLSEFYIRVGSRFNEAAFDPTSFTECWYQSSPMGKGEIQQFNCTSVISGRYVTIHFSSNKTEYLTLCEVEVYTEEGKSVVVAF